MKPESGCCGDKAVIIQQVLSPKAKAWMKHTYAEEVVAFYTPFKPQHTYLTFSTAAQMEGHKHRVELHAPWPTLHNS